MTCKVSEVEIQNNVQEILKNFKYVWVKERNRREKKVHNPRRMKGKWKYKLNI